MFYHVKIACYHLSTLEPNKNFTPTFIYFSNNPKKTEFGALYFFDFHGFILWDNNYEPRKKLLSY